MGAVDLIHLAQDRDWWQTCDCGNEFLGLQNTGNFLGG